MDSLIFELQIVLYFQLFLSANVRHTGGTVFITKKIRKISYKSRILNRYIFWPLYLSFTVEFTLTFRQHSPNSAKGNLECRLFVV